LFCRSCIDPRGRTPVGTRLISREVRLAGALGVPRAHMHVGKVADF
jgi:hypothetical protein